MNAVEYLKKQDELCNYYGEVCRDCPLGKNNNGYNIECNEMSKKHPVKSVYIVKKWSEQRKKTRQSEFMKMFPNATLDMCGSLDICPIIIDKNMSCSEKAGAKCIECRKQYWLAEIK